MNKFCAVLFLMKLLDREKLVPLDTSEWQQPL